MNQVKKNPFIAELKKLAEQQSPTLMKIKHIKSLDTDGFENVNDPDYLMNSCALLAAEYIRAIDGEAMSFASDSGRMQFLWLLQILTDIAAGGNMESLFKRKITLKLVR